MNGKSIGINELISKIKQELYMPLPSRQEGGLDVPEMFQIERVKLQISFTIEGTGEGGIDLKVVRFGATYKQGEVQTITIDLTPIQ